MKYLQMMVCVLLFSSAYADERVAPQLDSLIGLLNDSYSGEFVQARKYRSFKLSNTKEYVVSTFTIEGFHGGNNWTQFLSVFRSSYKFNELGEPKGEARFRLIGFVELSAKHKPKVNFNDVTLEKNTLIFPVITKSGVAANISVVIKQKSLEIQ